VRSTARTSSGPIASSKRPSPSIKTANSERSRDDQGAIFLAAPAGHARMNRSPPKLNREETPRPDRALPTKSHGQSAVMVGFRVSSHSTVRKMCCRMANIRERIFPARRGIGRSLRVHGRKRDDRVRVLNSRRCVFVPKGQEHISEGRRPGNRQTIRINRALKWRNKDGLPASMANDVDMPHYHPSPSSLSRRLTSTRSTTVTLPLETPQTRCKPSELN